MATTLAQPSVNALIIDNGILRGDVDVVERLAVAMIVLAGVNLAAALTSSYLAAGISSGYAHRLRTRLQRRVADFGDTEAARFGTSSLLARSTSDVLRISNFIFAFATIAVIAPLLLVGAIVLTALGGRAMTPVIATAGLALCWAVVALVTRLIPLSRQLQKLTDRLNTVVRSQLSGIEVIRTCLRAGSEKRRFDDVSTDLSDVAARSGRLQTLLLPSVAVIANLATVVVAGVGAVLVDTGAIPIGQIAAATGYLMQILVAVSMFSMLIGVVPRAATSAERVSEVLAIAPRRGPTHLTGSEVPTDALDEGCQQGPRITFTTVTYRWPGASSNAVSDVSLVCEPGRTTSLIGGTGSGKTTLLATVIRLGEPASGAIRWNSADVADLDVDWLRSRVAYVAQGPSLISGTIADNLRMGKTDATDKDLWTALETACAADFVASRAGGLAAEVTQEGKNFSGGQRQRLALARALVRRPSLYLLDDPFSALDVDTERTVIQRLRTYAPEATVVIAAQRVTSVCGADTVAVIERGRIGSVGDHESLMSESPIYREIALAQAAVHV